MWPREPAINATPQMIPVVALLHLLLAVLDRDTAPKLLGVGQGHVQAASGGSARVREEPKAERLAVHTKGALGEYRADRAGALRGEVFPHCRSLVGLHLGPRPGRQAPRHRQVPHTARSGILKFNQVKLFTRPYYQVPKGTQATQYVMRKVAPRKVWPPMSFGASLTCWYEHITRTACLAFSKNHRLWESITKSVTMNSTLEGAQVELKHWGLRFRLVRA
ncbi:hypothetical protein SAY86_022327 [Trapa natans]|uniref:Secreted protein n=1 Tax=Trapa natans TaxID=22666 RepID=A0AAN7LTB6_TRANT|nr:hypothetical protein SAY86_022327 [Trapa natans]